MNTFRPLCIALAALLAGGGLLAYADTVRIEQVERDLTVNAPPPVLGRVIIDPGHGGIDGGCHRDTLFEKDVVLDIALRVRDLLRDQGVDVLMTREVDTALDHLIEKSRLPIRHKRDLLARIVLARMQGVDVLVSIHANSSSNTVTEGAMFFFGPHSEEASALAYHIHEQVSLLQRGRQFLPSAAEYYMVNRYVPVAVLVEVGFLSNDRERSLLSDPQYRQSMAEAITRGIVQFLENYRGITS
ncbi:MAG TPA: N-acetylmuramoyl-L-alanine amidase [Clostridia bacterium]|nr:N-acetylmuramoyl-L-alanine amidase [Clostridia bacterium]